MTARTGRTTRVARLVGALLLTAAWVALPQSPARAAGEPVVERPTPGERVTHDGAFTVTGAIEAAPGEEIRSMEARLLSGGRQVGAMQTMDFVESIDTGPGMRRTRWAAPLDPLRSWDEGAALYNGAYRVEVRATVVFQGVQRQPTAWRGVDFTIDVDPPTTTVTTNVLDAEARRVEVAWEPVYVPDFIRYVIQRRFGTADWTDYREVRAMDTTRWADVVPGDGDWSYRVQSYRASAGGGERKSSWSAPATASVRKPPPPPPPDDTTGAGAAGGPGAPPPPPVLRVRSAPMPRQPTFVAPDTFEETLDYSGAEVPLTSGPEDDQLPDGAPAEVPSQLRVREDRDFPVRQALVPVAAGLVLTVSAWHVRRFLRVPTP